MKAPSTTSACSCPSCGAYLMANPNGAGEYCPSCLTVVTRLRHVRIVRPGAYRQDL